MDKPSEREIELEETLRKVCEQRDRAHRCIGELVDSFWSAHYNHAFDSEDEEEDTKKLDENGKPTTYRCSAGRSLRDCFHGCNIFDDKEAGCKGYDCPMGYYHRRMYEFVRKADDVLDEPAAELKKFDLSRIPKWSSSYGYKVTSKWYAKMLLSFFIAFKMGENYTKKEWEQWSDAFTNLLRIGLANYGIALPKDLKGLEKEDMNDLSPNAARVLGEIKRFIESRKELIERIEKYEHGDPDVFDKALVADEELAMFYLLQNTIIFMGDFAFGKDYPSCDLGVYGDYISSLKYRCVSILGLPRNNFDIIKFLNDTNDKGLTILGGDAA